MPLGSLDERDRRRRGRRIAPVGINVVPGGPLWVTGGITITNAAGDDLETRNRMTLCRCGASGNKPLCDGSHEDIEFEGIS